MRPCILAPELGRSRTLPARVPASTAPRRATRARVQFCVEEVELREYTPASRRTSVASTGTLLSRDDSGVTLDPSDKTLPPADEHVSGSFQPENPEMSRRLTWDQVVAIARPLEWGAPDRPRSKSTPGPGPAALLEPTGGSRRAPDQLQGA